VSDDGQRCPIDSGQVNDLLRDAMGDDFTAKDFRTWGATLLAITLLARTPLPDIRANVPEERDRRGVRQVAAKLRNTLRSARNPISTRRYSTPGRSASFTRSSTAA